MATYKPHSITIHTDAMGGAVTLQDTLTSGLQLNPDMRAEITAPNTRPTHVALVGMRPALTGATYDLPTFFDNIGVSGLSISGAVNPGLKVFWQKFDDYGITSGSGHRSLRIAKGVMVPRTLRVDHQGDARIDYEVVVIGDGTNASVVIDDSASLPTPTTSSARWTLGPITIGGKTLSEYTGLEINFGNEVTVRGSQSYIDPTHIEQRTFAPTITITGIDPTWFSSSNVPYFGLATPNATSKIYLRKRTQDGDNFVANGTSSHIKFVPAGLAAVGGAIQADVQRLSETSVMLTCAHDGTNEPLVCTTATTIT